MIVVNKSRYPATTRYYNILKKTSASLGKCVSRAARGNYISFTGIPLYSYSVKSFNEKINLKDIAIKFDF